MEFNFYVLYVSEWVHQQYRGKYLPHYHNEWISVLAKKILTNMKLFVALDILTAHMRIRQPSWVLVMNDHRWIQADNIWWVILLLRLYCETKKKVFIAIFTCPLSWFGSLDLFTVLKLSLLRSTNSSWCKGAWGRWSDWWARRCWCWWW